MKIDIEKDIDRESFMVHALVVATLKKINN